MRKSLLFLLLALMGYSFFELAVRHLADGFSLDQIRSHLPYSIKWEVTSPPYSTLQDILSQNFYYLGKGSQCYVFESEDKDVVLKFFRHSRYRLPAFACWILEPPFLAKIVHAKAKAKKEKLDALFNSCKLAYQQLPAESGLLYLHLNKTAYLRKEVTLYDKLKRPFSIFIDDYEFIIQKRGEQIFPHLSQLLDRGKTEEAKAALADLATILCNRLKKGIVDLDPVIQKNSGFRGHKAFFLDVGGFTYMSPKAEDLQKTTRQLRAWLQHKDPELAAYFDKELEETRWALNLF
jgi:hypothetical protein